MAADDRRPVSALDMAGTVVYGRRVLPDDRRRSVLDPSASAVTRSPIRFAVATEDRLVRWQGLCIDALAAVPNVSIVHWIRLPVDDGRPKQTEFAALADIDVPGGLRDLSTAGPVEDDPADGSRISVDVLLDLTATGVGSSVVRASETWSFAYGRGLIRDPARVALLDYVRGPGVTRVALVSEPSGTIVREGCLQTVSWWSGRPVDGLRLGSVEWPALEVRRRTEEQVDTVEAGGPADISAGQASRDRPAARDPAARIPGPVLEVAAVGRRMRGWVDVLTRHPDWRIGILGTSIERLLGSDEVPSVDWLPPRPGHFAADPFGLERDGLLHVFYEDFDHAIGRGWIDHVAIDPAGIVSEATRVLDPGVHVSYPFVLEHDGGTYMLPEASASGSLVLYEAADFPLQWRPAATILPDVPAIDASVVEFEGRWWLFATRADRGGNLNLFVWHAPDLFGPWTAHASNPVKTDARSARPGGTPFVHDGRLYRPSQDNSGRYGGSLVLNVVVSLTPTTFEERPARLVAPFDQSCPDGLHTLSAAGSRTLIDGNRLRFSSDALRFAVAGKFPLLRAGRS